MKNKRAFTDIDMLKIIAVFLLLLIGYIIVRAFMAKGV